MNSYPKKMAAQKLEPFSAEISPADVLSEKLDLSLLFGGVEDSGLLSPVDRYLENSNRLNKIFLDNVAASTYTNELGTLLLLGLVSAVESYLRGIIRGLVQVDEWVAKLVAPQQVTFFAAFHHTKSLLPEALLEGVSFISQNNISKTLKEFCGISGMTENGVPKALEPIFEKFGHICQLRHCCVHRFGLLGADNARRLNLPASHLEKPIVISSSALEEISLILEKFVCSLNSYIYADVIQRSLWMSSLILSQAGIKYTSTWDLDFSTDEERFSKYYDLFAIAKFKPGSPTLWEEYERFLTWAKECLNVEATIAKFKASKSGAPKNTQVPSAPSSIPAPVASLPGAQAIQGDGGFSALPQAAADALAAAAAQ